MLTKGDHFHERIKMIFLRWQQDLSYHFIMLTKMMTMPMIMPKIMTTIVTIAMTMIMTMIFSQMATRPVLPTARD